LILFSVTVPRASAKHATGVFRSFPFSKFSSTQVGIFLRPG